MTPVARLGDMHLCPVPGQGTSPILSASSTARAIVDFAKLGAIRLDGSVDDALMAELLADPHLQQRALLSRALVQPGGSAATTANAPLTPELHCAVSPSSTHADDRWPWQPLLRSPTLR
ncbi:hypothetical protein [Pseudomonas sp. LP_7_YM]|uniref:hypothetical protein n=1 Tax=Pseudomonas sp. LP_7_YM TaxID=2485137 RepID=UPI0010EC4BC0|nr:hypothetical protein [Pseudomonas sp. LP_7_YM]TDV65881.1 hypothetical protein EC915_104161 [Pseudomonas sp. LP_7_YM]